MIPTTERTVARAGTQAPRHVVKGTVRLNKPHRCLVCHNASVNPSTHRNPATLSWAVCCRALFRGRPENMAMLSQLRSIADDHTLLYLVWKHG